jgi:hypothetical protein
MVRLAAVAAPVAEKICLDHVTSMLIRNLTRQVVKLQLTQPKSGAIFIHLREKPLPGEWNVFNAEPATLDQNLAARNRAKAHREWRGGLQKETTPNVSLIQAHVDRARTSCPPEREARTT